MLIVKLAFEIEAELIRDGITFNQENYDLNDSCIVQIFNQMNIDLDDIYIDFSRKIRQKENIVDLLLSNPMYDIGKILIEDSLTAVKRDDDRKTCMEYKQPLQKQLKLLDLLSGTDG